MGFSSHYYLLPHVAMHVLCGVQEKKKLESLLPSRVTSRDYQQTLNQGFLAVSTPVLDRVRARAHSCMRCVCRECRASAAAAWPRSEE